MGWRDQLLYILIDSLVFCTDAQALSHLQGQEPVLHLAKPLVWLTNQQICNLKWPNRVAAPEGMKA